VGLDQYAFAVMPHRDNTDFSVRWTRENTPEGVTPAIQLAYWRKHTDLHGFVEQLFRDRAKDQNYTPQDGMFNCQPFRLTLNDLIALREAIEENDLPHTTGFFFGESTSEKNAATLEFIDAAQKAIAQDMEIYYDSLW